MAIADLMRSFLGGTPAPAVPANGQSASVGAPGTGNLAPTGSGNAAAFNNGGNPAAGQGPTGAPATPQSALDNFKDLWQIDPNAAKAPTVTPSLAIDPTKLQAAVSGMSFTGGLSPELMQKALGGDQQAFMEAMNGVAQTAFAQSLQAASKMTEQALMKQAEGMKAVLPTELKKQQITDGLISKNPLFANPTVQPFVTMIREQLSQKYPEASGVELTNMANELFTGLAAEIQKPALAIQTQNQQTTAAAADKSTDWNAFFSADSATPAQGSGFGSGQG